MVFRLNPLAIPFTPMGAKLVRCSARPMLVRQMAVPKRKISWAPSLVTEKRVFDFEKGAEARQCPQGTPRLCKIKREDGDMVDSPLEETLMWEKLFTAELLREEREEKENEEWKEQRMNSWLDSATTALPPNDRLRMVEELNRDIEEMCESLRKINLNYCE